MQNRTAIEMIKQKLPIESVVGSYVKLDRVGAKWKACCPFHNEKTASFQVDPDKGFYYCFGCHKGGDIFNFVQEIEGLEFFDALKSLAEKAGVELSEFKNEKPSRSAILREIMDNAARFYEVGLRTNKEVVDYLLSRGLTKQTMIDFRIGYAMKGWGNLYEYLKKKKYTDDDIVATGLCLKSDKGRAPYDRFRERIMFPILDSQGRSVIAFSGRTMPGTEEAAKPVGKYVNSPDTELYHKSKVLYGFDKAKSAIHTAGFAIVVEGQMDIVMAHQAGTKNVVALSGTACTDEQVTQLSRFTNEIVLCLDDDVAGLNASLKSAMVAYKHELKVGVISITSGKDPADLIKEDVNLWLEAIKQKKDFVTFRLEKMKQKGQGEDKLQIAKKELFPVLQQMQFQMSIDEKLQEIAKSFEVSADAIRKDFERFVKSSGVSPQSAPIKPLIPKDHQKEGLMGNMIGILLSFGSNYPTLNLRKKFDDLGRNYDTIITDFPADQKAKYLAEVESALGPVTDNIETYERMFHQFHTRYKLILLDEEKHTLDTILHGDPNNADALAKLHSIMREKDHLIHSLHTH